MLRHTIGSFGGTRAGQDGVTVAGDVGLFGQFVYSTWGAWAKARAKTGGTHRDKSTLKMMTPENDDLSPLEARTAENLHEI